MFCASLTIACQSHNVPEPMILPWASQIKTLQKVSMLVFKAEDGDSIVYTALQPRKLTLKSFLP
jgi:hypothetical protein